jgi:hypothetical protein
VVYVYPGGVTTGADGVTTGGVTTGGVTTAGAGGPMVSPGGVAFPNKSPVPEYNSPVGVMYMGLPF